VSAAGGLSRALVEAPKRHRTGTHRVMSPEDTLERVRPLLAPMGITRIANVTGLDVIGVPVVMVTRPNARSLSVTQGKGLDLASARASGVMEAVEAWHAERVRLPLSLGSHEELRLRRRVVDVGMLPRGSRSTFRPSRRLLWVEGQEIASGEPTLVPFEMVHLDYRLPLPEGSGAFVMSSSGLASGNHRLEAVVHGICELIEHDATALFVAGGETSRRRVELASVGDAGCRAVIDAFGRAGVLVGVWETTTDVGVPAFLCTIGDRDPDPAQPTPLASGMGCHPAREIALSRALTEAAQSRLTRITGARDDVGPAGHDREAILAALRRFAAELDAGPASRAFDDAPTFDGASLDADVAWLLERLRAAGIAEVVAVDLTHEEIGIPVVRVVIPGLEHPPDAPGDVPGPRARRAREAA